MQEFQNLYTSLVPTEQMFYKAQKKTDKMFLNFRNKIQGSRIPFLSQKKKTVKEESILLL